MCVISSSVFHVLIFSHEGKLMTIDQLSYTRKICTHTSKSNVPLVNQLHPTNEILGAGMYTSLIDTFDFPAPINLLGLTSVGKTICTIVYRTDPWVLSLQADHDVPLSAAEIAYHTSVDATIDPLLTPFVSEESEEAYIPALAVDSTYSHDCLDMALSSDESILKAMIEPHKVC